MIPLHPLPRTPAQITAIDELRTKYPPPWVVGWHCTDTGVVRGTLYATVADDEAGIAYRRFSVYSDGTVSWWTRDD